MIIRIGELREVVLDNKKQLLKMIKKGEKMEDKELIVKEEEESLNIFEKEIKNDNIKWIKRLLMKIIL